MITQTTTEDPIEVRVTTVGKARGSSWGSIYPREIEKFLFSCPSILDVQVIGVPDAKNGEAEAVWARLKPGAALS